MIIVSFVFLVFTTIGVVFTPWIFPFLLISVSYLIKEHSMSPFFIILTCSITATITTAGIWFLNNRIYKYFEKKQKNDQRKKGITRKMRRWFDHTFSIIKNKRILLLAVAIGSGSLVPDIFLVEFGRIKMKFSTFITAIAIGKFCAYCIMMLGIERMTTFLLHTYQTFSAFTSDIINTLT